MRRKKVAYRPFWQYWCGMRGVQRAQLKVTRNNGNTTEDPPRGAFTRLGLCEACVLAGVRCHKKNEKKANSPVRSRDVDTFVSLHPPVTEDQKFIPFVVQKKTGTKFHINITTQGFNWAAQWRKHRRHCQHVVSSICFMVGCITMVTSLRQHNTLHFFFDCCQYHF